MKLFLISIFILLFAGGYNELHSAYSGGMPGTEQKYSVDARMEGAGNAFDALSDGISSIYYNPAGLSHIRNAVLMGSYLPLWDTETYGFFVGGAVKIKNFSLGAGTLNVLTDNIIIRGEDMYIKEFAEYRNSLFLFCAACQFTEGFSMGLRANLVSQGILQYHDSAWGLDFSLLLRTQSPYLYTPGKFLRLIKPYSLGLTIYNALQPRIKLRKKEEKFPLMFKAGLSYRIKQIGNVLSIEPVIGVLGLPQYRIYKFSPGMEVGLWQIFYLRAGYRITDRQITAGSGLDLKNITVDYGMTFLGIDMNLYVFDVKVKF